MPAGVLIPYNNLVAQHAPLKSELLAAVGQVLDRGVFILGEEVATFETRFAELCQVRHAIGVGNGTDALILALKAAGVTADDEVVTVANTFVASVSAIQLLGARAVLVDALDDYTIDPVQVASAITPRTRAIMPVHLTGRPCDMDALMAIAGKHGVAVVEDAAQAVTATYRGRSVGSFGIGCFSLHPLKTLNACGDGGVITTNEPDLADRFRLMRNLGLRTREDCVMWAGNSRLDTLQAALLLVKLKHLERWTETRRRNVAIYRDRLEDVAEVIVPTEPPHMRAVYHTLVVLADRRDDLQRFLAEQGIGSAIHYPVPVHLMTAGRELGYPRGSFPVTEQQATRILSLPVYPELTADDINQVCDTIRAFYGRG